MYAETGGTSGTLNVTALTAGTAFTIAVLTEDAGGTVADTQTMVTNNVTLMLITQLHQHIMSLLQTWSSYANSDTITILGVFSVEQGVNDLTITVQTVDAQGGITGITVFGTPWDGNRLYLNFAANPTAFNATFTPRISTGHTLQRLLMVVHINLVQFVIPGVSLGGVAAMT